MKYAAWGALALVLWTALAFGVGRATVPDRTAEVRAWRDSAAAVGREAAAATAAWAAAEAHARQMEARADSAMRRVATVQSESVRRDSTITVWRDSLAVVATLADTAALQAAIIAHQDTVIQSLRVGLTGAGEALAGLRADAAAAREALQAAHAENARLRGIIAAGLEATRPGRGRGSGLRTAAVAFLAGALVWEVAR